MVKIRKMLELAGKHTLDDLDKFVLSNMVFFGTAKQGEIPEVINQDVCAKQTLKLIDILKPKVVLLLGDQSRDLFKKNANITQLDELIPGYHDFYCFYKGYHVISIYHTAYYAFFTNERMKIIGNILGYALDNPSKSIDKMQLESYISKKSNESLIMEPTTERTEKTVEKRFKLFKAQIESNGADSCSLLYGGKLLNYEFYTKKDAEGKHLKTPDRIAVDMLLEGNDYVIRVGTRRNDPEKTKRITNAVDDRFTPGNTELTGAHWHVHAKFAQETPDDKIIEDMNDLLMRINFYRNGKLSSK